MRRAFTVIELMIVLSIIAIIAALAIPAMRAAHHKPPLTDSAIHMGDVVQVGWRDGVIVDILPPRADGQPMRFVVRYTDDGHTVTNTYFANELRAR